MPADARSARGIRAPLVASAGSPLPRRTRRSCRRRAAVPARVPTALPPGARPLRGLRLRGDGGRARLDPAGRDAGDDRDAVVTRSSTPRTAARSSAPTRSTRSATPRSTGSRATGCVNGRPVFDTALSASSPRGQPAQPSAGPGAPARARGARTRSRASSARRGTARCPPATTSPSSSPNLAFSASFGSGRIAGRPSTRPSVFENSRFVTGFGAVGVVDAATRRSVSRAQISSRTSSCDMDPGHVLVAAGDRAADAQA